MKFVVPGPVKFFFVFIFIVFTFFSCQKSTTARVSGGGPPSGEEVFKDVQYGSNTDLQGNNVALKLDVYIPANAAANEKFPFVLFVHGGGFVAGDKSGASAFLQNFVEQGYVAASIDYRLDSSIDGVISPCDVDTGITQKGLYMAVQDTRAAMRFMVANAAKYHIDTSSIFLNGNSAGAITVLNAHFLTQSDFNTMIPGVENELGGIDNADNTVTNTSRIIGMAANSGCLSNPGYMTSSNVVPVIFFHGGQDSVIPIDHGHTYYCPNTLYVYGSNSLYKRMVQLGESGVIHVDPSGGHGPYTDNFLAENEICFFNSILGRKIESGSYTAQQSSCH